MRTKRATEENALRTTRRRKCETPQRRTSPKDFNGPPKIEGLLSVYFFKSVFYRDIDKIFEVQLSIDGVVDNILNPQRSGTSSASKMRQYMFNFREHLLQLKIFYREAVTIEDL